MNVSSGAQRTVYRSTDGGATWVQSSSGLSRGWNVAFGDPGRSRFTSALPLVSSPSSSLVFGQVASGQLYFTGMALLNPGDGEATALIELFKSTGKRVASKNEMLPAHRRRSQLLTQYFTGLVGQDVSGGYIKVTSNRGLASFALFGTQSLTALSAVPAQITRAP